MTTKANGTGPLSLREVQRAAVVDTVEDGYQRVVLYNALTLPVFTWERLLEINRGRRFCSSYTCQFWLFIPDLKKMITLLEVQGYITFRDGIIKPARRLHEAVTLYRATIEARGSEAAD